MFPTGWVLFEYGNGRFSPNGSWASIAYTFTDQRSLVQVASLVGWTGIALCVKITPLKSVPAAQQLLFQVAVSAPLLLIAAMISGDLLRDPLPIHFAGMAFQIIAVASLGFLVWFWLMSIYPASSVASFSFLSPIFAVIFGWLLLGEDVGVQVWIALGLVSAGIYLINRPEAS